MSDFVASINNKTPYTVINGTSGDDHIWNGGDYDSNYVYHGASNVTINGNNKWWCG